MKKIIENIKNKIVSAGYWIAELINNIKEQIEFVKNIIEKSKETKHEVSVVAQKILHILEFGDVSLFNHSLFFKINNNSVEIKNFVKFTNKDEISIFSNGSNVSNYFSNYEMLLILNKYKEIYKEKEENKTQEAFDQLKG